jgi:hypothetical protein
MAELVRLERRDTQDQDKGMRAFLDQRTDLPGSATWTRPARGLPAT